MTTVRASGLHTTCFLALCAAAMLTQGCSAVGKLHSQFGFEGGHNFGDEPQNVENAIGVAELGYVTGVGMAEPPRWGFGGAAYLAIVDPLRPGMKAIARRYFDRHLSVDFSAGPMITYDSSGLFNGFIGGVTVNYHFVTLRSEYMMWPFEAWDGMYSDSAGNIYTVHHDGGHEGVWYNGVTFNGTSSWVAFAVAAGLLIAYGAANGFE
jgi:hypothetical protein